MPTEIAGTSVPHADAVHHATGTANYMADTVPRADELIVDVLTSPVACGRITKLDVSAAREYPGIACVVTASDIPGQNLMGHVIADEEILASEHVCYVGQPVALIAGKSRAAVQAARNLVVLEIEPETPILTIDDAIEAESFIGSPLTIEDGDVNAAFASAPHLAEGVAISGGQEHVYFEPQGAIAYPPESGMMHIISSTQHPGGVQKSIAHALGLKLHAVKVSTRRMGGAFGGKETQGEGPATYAALVAYLTRRSARLIYDQATDMLITGKRHEFKSHYKVAFDASGRILALEVRHFSNGGFSADLSLAVLGRALFHTENTSKIANYRTTGRVCRTNLPSRTAFRGFGGPQGMRVHRKVIDTIAARLNLDPLDVELLNLYREGESTPYGQVFTGNNLPALLQSARSKFRYDEIRREVAAFNATNRRYLEGVSLAGVKFGISFTFTPLNRGGAQVLIYTDGSVLVTFGGTEMGQGLGTKVRQLVAAKLGIPLESVFIAETSTSSVPNASATAASAGTDLNGAAALDACEQILCRECGLRQLSATVLTEIAAEPVTPDRVTFEDGKVFDSIHPENSLTFGELCARADMARVHLAAQGYYRTPDLSWDPKTAKGSPFFYFTQAFTLARVRIDLVTGLTRVLALETLFDIGRPINPEMDRGQLIGGMMQGLGWVTMEELVIDAAGRLVSNTMSTYKIPSALDVPGRLTVEFLPGENPRVVGGSKAVAEPPVMAAANAITSAIYDALRSISPECADALTFPATGEEVLRVLRLTKNA